MENQKWLTKLKTRIQKKKREGDVICLKPLGLHNIRGHWWFFPSRIASKKNFLVVEKVSRKLTKFTLQTRMWRVIWTRLYTALIATFITYSKKFTTDWVSISKANNWNNNRSLKPHIQVLSALSTPYSSALKWAFKRVALEINKILVNILDSNGIKSPKQGFIIETEFGNFRIKLVKITNTEGLVNDLELVLPIKVFVIAYLFKIMQRFGLESEFPNRKTLYKTRMLKEARRNVYAIPLKCIEQILISFFESVDITTNYGTTTNLNNAIVSVKSSNKVHFSIKSLLNEPVLTKNWIGENVKNRKLHEVVGKQIKMAASLKEKARFFTSKLNQDIA